MLTLHWLGSTPKENTGAKKREMAQGSRITFLPFQQAKLTGEKGRFALGVNSQLQ